MPVWPTLLGLPVLLAIGSCNTPAPAGVPGEDQRLAFQSQCAQNVIECTVSWPVAMAEVVAGPVQTVLETASGFVVLGSGGDGVELVRLDGIASTPGVGATEITYRWSYGATDGDPRTLEPGVEFASGPEAEILLREGFHYIRLRVENDIIREEVVSDEFGVIGTNIPSFDFVEFEVVVQD